MGDIRRSSEVRQAELTDAALQIIATRGIAALSTRALADHVGLSSGAIFRHFASMDALLEAVVGRVEEVLDSTYPPAGLPPQERLERFVTARSTAVSKQLGILRLVVSEQFLLALPKAGSTRLGACVGKSREFVTACLTEGQHQGVFRRDVDARALATVVMGTTQMLALAHSGPRQDAALAQAVRDGLALLLQAPAVPGAKTRKRST